MEIDSKYFLMLDTLLDTRIGTILQCNDESISNINPAEYMARNSDAVLTKYHSEFVSLFNKRDKSVLSTSVLTHFASKALEDIVGDQRDSNLCFPDRKYSLDLNIWPYSANEEERLILKECMYELFPTVPTINVVYVSLEQMSPMWMCNMKYTMIAMYEFIKWVDLHKGAFEGERRYEGPLIVGPRLKDPKILASTTNALPQTVKDIVAQGKEWELVEVAFAERIAVRLYPASYFSSKLHPLTA